ncbi:hypothetical protein NM208_g14695 [Fusarium decemcellulare]|uniref:Uncharacterized protein n=1 Tax=Fusarium decemcellulare TaxID=57161 RepID=A0ACC1RFT2_9HYPO|nr:hypothetical protein NM208_g14695 [Fusarium decemcellulare]
MATPYSSGDASSTRSSASSASTTDPVLRNTLRYTISARDRVEKTLQPPKGGDDYNARTVRHALRVFVTTWLGMKGWDVVAKRMSKEE